MKNTTLLVLSCLISILFSCQKDYSELPAFEKGLGSEQDELAKAIVHSKQHLYVCGSSKSEDEQGDHYLLKLDAAGEVIWEEQYGGTAAESSEALLLHSNGCLYLAGTQKAENGNNKIHLLAINKQGKLLWEQSFGGSEEDSPTALIENEDRSISLIGTTKSYGNGDRDLFFLQVDEQGELIQRHSYGGPDKDGGSALAELRDGWLLYGYTLNFGATSRDHWLVRINEQGDTLWTRRYSGAGYEESQAMQLSESGEIYLLGHSSSNDPLHNMQLLKIAADGQLLWQKDFGGLDHDGGEALLIDSQGRLVLVGQSMSYGSGSNAAWMLICDEQGNELESHVFNQDRYDFIHALVEFQGAYYLVGESNSFSTNGDKDVYLIRHLIE